MASFQDLGLRDALLQILDEEEIERPTALQQSVIPVLRRGGNLVARTSSGSGKTLAYGLGVLDQLKASEEEDEETPLTQALVLVPTAEAAERVATALFPYVNGSGLALAVASEAWGTAAGQAQLLIATPASALAAVRDSAVKLDGLKAVVIDGASAIEALGEWSAVDTLLDHLPRDAQRVVSLLGVHPGGGRPDRPARQARGALPGGAGHCRSGRDADGRRARLRDGCGAREARPARAPPARTARDGGRAGALLPQRRARRAGGRGARHARLRRRRAGRRRDRRGARARGCEPCRDRRGNGRRARRDHLLRRARRRSDACSRAIRATPRRSCWRSRASFRTCARLRRARA